MDTNDYMQWQRRKARFNSIGLVLGIILLTAIAVGVWR